MSHCIGCRLNLKCDAQIDYDQIDYDQINYDMRHKK